MRLLYGFHVSLLNLSWNIKILTVLFYSIWMTCKSLEQQILRIKHIPKNKMSKKANPDSVKKKKANNSHSNWL